MSITNHFDEILKEIRQLKPDIAHRLVGSMIRSLTRLNDQKAAPVAEDPRPLGLSQNKVDAIEASESPAAPSVLLKFERNNKALGELMTSLQKTYAEAPPLSKEDIEYLNSQGIGVLPLIFPDQKQYAPGETVQTQMTFKCQDLKVDRGDCDMADAIALSFKQAFNQVEKPGMTPESLNLYNWLLGSKDDRPTGLMTFTSQAMREVRGELMRRAAELNDLFKRQVDKNREQQANLKAAGKGLERLNKDIHRLSQEHQNGLEFLRKKHAEDLQAKTKHLAADLSQAVQQRDALKGLQDQQQQFHKQIADSNQVVNMLRSKLDHAENKADETKELTSVIARLQGLIDAGALERDKLQKELKTAESKLAFVEKIVNDKQDVIELLKKEAKNDLKRVHADPKVQWGAWSQVLDLAHLKTGMIVRHMTWLGKSPFIVSHNYGSRVTAVATADITNASEWEMRLEK